MAHDGQQGRVLGRYVLCGELASGGMATVHLARHLGPHGFCRSVAVKRLHEGHAKDPDFVAMFLDEARLASRIHHPNVASIIDVISTPSDLCLVMDYLHGESLAQLQRRADDAPIALPIACAIVVDALRGLHAAHEVTDLDGIRLELVHRDVSPQNLFVGADGVTRVLDFGIAKASARSQVTRDGQVKGKLAYMAPEQIRSEPADRRVDVFATGVVLWELLTGERLYGHKDPGAAIHDILFRDRVPPSERREGIPKALDDVVMRALAREPSVRFESAEAMAEAILAACSPATSAVVGAWVRELAGALLLTRKARLRAAERLGVDELEEFTKASKGTDADSLQLAIQQVLDRDALADEATMTDEMATGGDEVDESVAALLASREEPTLPPSAPVLPVEPVAPPAPVARGRGVVAAIVVALTLVAAGAFLASREPEPRGLVGITVPQVIVPAGSDVVPAPTAAEVASAPAEASASASAAAVAPRRPVPLPRPVSVPSARCSPPYYFDDGIKRYKPECL